MTGCCLHHCICGPHPRPTPPPGKRPDVEAAAELAFYLCAPMTRGVCFHMALTMFYSNAFIKSLFLTLELNSVYS